MSSSFTINYSLRQNKALERALAFEALSTVQPYLGENCVYIGLGSVWFQDFQLARRVLGITDMISIESDPVIFSRACFNRPFGSVEVLEGLSSEILPEVLKRDDFRERTYIIWLDYDNSLTHENIQELSDLVRRLPSGSALLATFSATGSRYAKGLNSREKALVKLFGEDIVGNISSVDEMRDQGLMVTLADCALKFLSSKSAQSGQSHHFVSGIRLLYQDSSPMVTIGGFLVPKSSVGDVENLVSSETWCGWEEDVIASHPLTIREMQALSQLLPSASALTATDVAGLGFELGERQISLFERHYLRYPVYAELR